MLLRNARIYPFYFSTMAAFNGDYQQLATALLVQAGVAGAAGASWRYVFCEENCKPSKETYVFYEAN